MIREAIISCLNQTYENIEIVVVNDGSTDNTKYIVEELQNNSNKIKLVNQENQGVSKARITGLNECNGEYITFLDSDDLISKNYVSNLVAVLEKNNVPIALARRYQKIGPLRILYNKYPEYINLEESKQYLPTIWVGVNCKIYKREKLNLLDFGLKANEDLAFNYYDLATKKIVGCDNKSIYVQRFASNSLAKDLIYGNLNHIDNTLKPLEFEKILFEESNLKAEYYFELEAIFIKNIFERIFNISTSNISKDKKKALIDCLIKYLNYHFPTWKANKYYTSGFKGFPIDSRLYVNVASLFLGGNITSAMQGYEETMNNFNNILKLK